MTTTGSESFEQPFKGQDGKYQIRIESYDPARNTMKAIWLVSRNQRLLSQLLDKCEVSNSETSNEALRGNLLSVQRELQELRQAMDHHDGTQTPVLDTSDLGIERGFEDFSMFDSTAASIGGEISMPSVSAQSEDVYQTERASSAFGFGASNRRRSVLALSQIPQYPRPSIRTDFCVSSFEPFPAIRESPSKIPKCPPPPPPKKKKGKKAQSSTLPRPKTSLSGRGSRLSSYGDRPVATRSILKTSPMNKRPATSMALTHSVTKKVSFGDPIEEPNKRCQSRSTPCEKKKSKAPVAKTKRQTDVRPSTSLGVRTIPRSSSRMSGVDNIKSRSGRLSAMEMSSKKVSAPRKSTTSHTERATAAKSKAATKPMAKSKKTGLATASAAKSGGRKSGLSSGKSLKALKMEAKKAKRAVRPKSAMEVPSMSHLEVLPFESPPPQPKLLSQPNSLTSVTENTSEDSASAMIRSVSIIDDDSEMGDPFNEVKRALPRIRVGDGEPSEYKVKAYFLDELEDFPEPAPVDSGVIPSSPVEVDASATATASAQRDASPEPQTARLDVRAASVHDEPSSTVLEPVATEHATCNNTDGVKVDAIKNETSVSKEAEEESASIEATYRDPRYETTSFPELGMDFLPEFENEVNGLLDTLMSQDLLTTTFSQDRLFSTESNFMESCMDVNEPSSSQRFSEQEVLQEDTTKEAIQEENEMLQTIVEETKEPSLQTTDAALMEQVTVESKMNSELAETMNKDYSTQDVVSETEGETDNNDVDEDMEETIMADICAVAEKEENLSREVDATCELPSIRVEDPLSCTNETFSKPIGESLRRRSTGSYDAAALSLSVPAAMKPCGHRRSTSHNELDAMMTNNDGYDKQTPSPGFSKEGGIIEQQWSGESAADPLHGAESCSMFSSSELTVPDTCETYRNVHHGYSPSFATADLCGENRSRQSLPRSQSLVPNIEWCVFNPVALAPSPRLRPVSFDFLSGNRAHLQHNSLAQGVSELRKLPILSTPTIMRTVRQLIDPQKLPDLSLGYESESSGEVFSAAGGEFDEIEGISTFDVQSSMSRDGDLYLKTTGPYTTWEDSHNKEQELRSHVSEEGSEGEHSVIPTSVYLQTEDDDEVDRLDEVPSIDVAMNRIHAPASSRRSIASSIVMPPRNNPTPSKASASM